MIARSKNFILLLALSASLSAGCTPTVAQHGNMLEDYQIAEIKPGISTRSDVLRLLGSPTTQAPFDENIWYYLGQETQKKGILDPKVTKERIVIVAFDQQGTVAVIRPVNPGREDVPIATQKTPTHGNDITIMQQLLGNIGRFNKAEKE